MGKFVLTIVSLALAGCATLPPGDAAQPPAVVIAEIGALEERLESAFNNRDDAALESIIAPEYTLARTGAPQGLAITGRDDWFKVWRTGKQLPYTAKVLNVVAAGDTAVATLEASWQRNSYLVDTWARRDGRWQLVFRHSVARP